jgi:mRNA interferase RelE/StbE
MNIVIKKTAAKEIQKIQEPYKSKIKKKIKDLENFPHISNIKKLVNYNPLYRLRVGEYRVLFDIIDDHIEVFTIKHRQESYK